MINQLSVVEVTQILLILVTLIIGLLQWSKYRAESKSHNATAAEKITNASVALVGVKDKDIAVLNLLIIKQRRFTRKLLKRIESLEEKLEMETGERFREAKTCRETVAELDKKNRELLKSNAGLQQQIDKLSDLLSAYMNEDNAKRISTVNNVGPVQ